MLDAAVDKKLLPAATKFQLHRCPISTGRVSGPARLMLGEGIPSRSLLFFQAEKFFVKKDDNLGNLCHALDSNKTGGG